MVDRSSESEHHYILRMFYFNYYFLFKALSPASVNRYSQKFPRQYGYTPTPN